MAHSIYNYFQEWKIFITLFIVWEVVMSILMVVILYTMRNLLKGKKNKEYLYAIWGTLGLILVIMPALIFSDNIYEQEDEINNLLSEYLELNEVSLGKAKIRIDLVPNDIECYTGISTYDLCSKGTIIEDNGNKYDVLVPSSLTEKLYSDKRYDVKFISEKELQKLTSNNFNIITSITESE